MTDPNLTDPPTDTAELGTPQSAEGAFSAAQRERAQARRQQFIKVIALYVFPGIMVALLIAIIIGFLRPPKADKTQPLVSTPPAAAPAGVAQAEDLARLQAEVDALRAVQGTPEAPAPILSAPELSLLNARLERLEAAQREVAAAALLARNAGALHTAAAGSAPFRTELDLVEKSLSEPGLLVALRPLAERGVTSESALALSFPQAAARANSAARTSAKSNDPLDWLGQWFGHFVSIRRTDITEGSDTAAILNRAEARLRAGDLAGAVAALDQLPQDPARAMKPWLDQARDRLVVNETTRRISELTLSRLSQMSLAGEQL